mgnify:CR=1 FL=1
MSTKKKKDKLNMDAEEMACQEEQTTEPEPELEKKEMDAKLADLEKECAEWKDKYLRSMAEFENYRRRSIQEKSDWIKLSTQKLALEICDVSDNFERALQQVTEEKKTDSFVVGVQMIEQQLRTVLEKEGVVRIEALGKEFDPSLHDALAHIPSEYEENLVAAVIQNGYLMNGKVLRPVRVAVSSGKIEQEKQEPESESEESSGGDGSETIEIKVN